MCYPALSVKTRAFGCCWGPHREHAHIRTDHHLCIQKVLHEDLLKEDARKRDPNSDEQLGVVRDTYTREITRGPMDGAA